MPTHLVTGGVGFIGSHLVASLIERGDDVVVLDNLDGGKTENVPDCATLIVGSVADQATVAELFASYRFDGVYHLAAFAAEGISHAVKHHNYSVNLLGSINLINASLAAKVRFFGFASSVAVYGHGHVPMREHEQPIPADSYGNAKLAVERELAATMKLQGLPYFALRMHNVYGERQNMGDPYRNAVAIFLNQIMRGEPISVYGDGSQVRAFTYAPDIVGTFLAASDQPAAWGQVFNVGSSHTTTVLDMAHAVCTAMGVPDQPIMHLAARNEVHAAYTDNGLARKVLGDWTDTPLADGLRCTAAWAREYGPVEPATSLSIENDTEDKSEWFAWASGRAVRS
ncbi:NAD-dependent epimerase/dehydratase family protein [Streptomyces sp. ME19-01-6]|uniref:NAD-dependent epimerase/dehydratase family protein n=1 Tax=Streptomyces sp. ME19-01-6 TaxID=3028686 RepID=UPI0029B61E6B|nr:NAD-dependent epimerase/dehydratase family protein [Streptomyces sp. ME19-01-6]MDX3224516.1 NAD-dependent epimerase/dehydratase family protein [Streptomyces sp. ME19-01-6]